MGYEIQTKDGIIYNVGNVVGPVKVILPADHTLGQPGKPTIEQYREAVRNELSDLLEPDHPIIITVRN